MVRWYLVVRNLALRGVRMMLEPWVSQHSTSVRLSLTATFLILGLAYLHFGLLGRTAVEPVQASTDYALCVLGTDRAAVTEPKIEQPMSFDSSALSQERGTRPVHRSGTGRPSENQSEDRAGRVQAFTMFAALLVQIESAGAGSR
jgi:hypothetical protein